MEGMSEAGVPNASVMELIFWEGLKRCVQDDESPLTVVPCDDTEDGGITFGRTMPPELWQHMADALAELKEAAGV